MRKLKWGIAFVIVVALGFWIASRWHTWFVEDPEEAYVPSFRPSHVLLTFGDTHPLSRNVSWQADTVLHPSWLEIVSLTDRDTLRVEAQGEVFRSRSGQAAYYMVRLRSLKAAMTYAYRAVSHCSTKNYKLYPNEVYDKFGTLSRYYQTVVISGDTLTMAAYEVYHHTLYDSLQIIKTPRKRRGQILFSS